MEMQAIDAMAEQLPFPDGSFDAATATFTMHQWSNLAKGISEMRRVTRGPIVIMTCDPSALYCFWPKDYCREVFDIEARRYPSIEMIQVGLRGDVEVVPTPRPLDCKDGFNEAYYGRPEMLLEPCARVACPAWSFVDRAAIYRFEQHLRGGLADGAWDELHGYLRHQPTFVGSLRIIVSR